MKNKSNYERETHVKNTLWLEDEGFVEIKEQKRHRDDKLHKGFLEWCYIYIYIYIYISKSVWFKTLHVAKL